MCVRLSVNTDSVGRERKKKKKRTTEYGEREKEEEKCQIEAIVRILCTIDPLHCEYFEQFIM